eukprot:gene19365-38671_t
MKLILGPISALMMVTAGTAAQANVIFFSTFDGLQAHRSWSIVQSADGWTTTGGPGIELQNNVAGSSFTGATNDVFVELDSHNGGSGQNNTTMSRTIAAPGQYLLEFLYSPRPGVAANSNGILVSLNGAALAPVFTQQGGGNTIWSTKTIQFTALSANSTLSFAGAGISDTLGGYVDNIRLTAVPEPATWAMMILGFGGVGAALRRRRASALA